MRDPRLRQVVLKGGAGNVKMGNFLASVVCSADNPPWTMTPIRAVLRVECVNRSADNRTTEGAKGFTGLRDQAAEQSKAGRSFQLFSPHREVQRQVREVVRRHCVLVPERQILSARSILSHRNTQIPATHSLQQRFMACTGIFSNA